jgi:diguanylate cyclase (GGDEF)-like protein
MDAAEHRIRSGEIFAVLFVDLDGFKPVNDRFGHPVGDLLLTAVSKRITDCAGDRGFVSRLGGDEFAILQGPLCSFKESADLACRIVGRLAEPFDLEGHRMCIGASVGIALAPADGSDSLNLMRYADLALYDAKRAGKGTFHYYRATTDNRVSLGLGD